MIDLEPTDEQIDRALATLGPATFTRQQYSDALFNVILQDYLDQMVADGLIEASHRKGEVCYALTPKGLAAASDLIRDTDG
ncbi:MAG: hypothetical protein OXI12_01730 [Gammaproteobacteria bacterium]|nr:hypothetical protein [Gammaproteobacteria bacterium]